MMIKVESSWVSRVRVNWDNKTVSIMVGNKVYTYRNLDSADMFKVKHCLDYPGRFSLGKCINKYIKPFYNCNVLRIEGE